MATRSATPRADNEGGIGTVIKKWATGFIKILTVDNITSSDLTASRSVVTDVNKKLISGSNTDTELAGAVSSKHTQGTDQGLDTGGANAITAATLKTLNDTTVPGKEDVANKSTNVVTDAASNTKYPSVKAFKDYADGLVVGLIDDRGSYNASGNAWPTTGGSGTAGAILKGDLWYISVAGTLGGVSVIIGSSIRALADSPGSTAANWDILNVGIGYTPENVANRRTTFQATPDDTHYPSEKLVKDSIDGKIAASITDGDTTHAPDGNSVFGALALKAPVTSPALVTPTRTTAPTDNDSSLNLATTAFAKFQDAVLHRDPDQGVALQAGAIAAVKVTHSATFSSTTNNAGYGGVFACPSWTPAATQVLVNKWAANVGYKLELLITSGIFRLTLNDTVYDSTVPGGGAASNLLAGSHHDILATPTVGASTTTVTFLLDGVLLNTTAAQANEEVTNTQDLYIGGTSAVTYAMTVYDVYHFNLAPTTTEWRLAYLEGIPEAWKFGSQTAKYSDTAWTGATGATAPTGWTIGGNGVFTIFDSGDGAPFNACLKMAVNAVPTPGPTIYKSYPVVIGRKYAASIWFKDGTAASTIIRFGSTAGSENYLAAYPTDAAWTKYSCEFTAVTATCYVWIRTNSAVAGEYSLYDEVSLYDLGVTFALTPESWQTDKPYDLSTNNNVCAYPVSGWSLTRPNPKKLWQPTPAAKTTAVTLTIAELLTGIITATHTAGATQAYELPTGTLCDAWPVFGMDRFCEWSLINLSAAALDTVTVTAHDNHTVVGNMIVQSANAATGGVMGNSALFRTRKTAANTFITYRIS